ncbi:thiamine pyrophosphate-binding protein [Aureimonas leprariae]|uniref:Thiamine pyrophosphate-binding protein n=1 Tax=Plantimonas leprariae TaxID=2615207 RepID=A0A7V7PPE4_9HYPH|nr:thiamine pyrophosphate-binding protein [Aureimonas leprariae]KAB0679839.1 thiamine pyrophosphate-binding protein [Aureimonas leprariae]
MAEPGGVLLVRALERQGVGRVFCVPGESYLPVLDALHDSSIETVVCRQEGGAAMMAEADGKITGRPGICFVTRGPGATNAASGVHVAAHDLTPMILFVGQVPHEFRGRGAFQEVDYDRLFGGMAKAVFEAETPGELPALVEDAFRIAMEGAPGPVVVALPEDTLSGEGVSEILPFHEVETLPPSQERMEELWSLLAEARSPIMVLGGPRWTDGALADIRHFAENWHLPVACSFRRQMLFPSLHPNHAGDVGIGVSPKLRARIEAADLILAIGARFGEMPSQGYELLTIPHPSQKLVHVLPEEREIGRLYQPTLGVLADPASFARKAVQLAPPATVRWSGTAEAAHRDYLEWSTVRMGGEDTGFVDLEAVMAHLASAVPDHLTCTNGAGNYGGWLHRYGRFANRLSQLAPTSGSMGYGLPAAIAMKLRHPERTVVAFAGDGCFQMTAQEFGTAVEQGLGVILLVIDNGQYGTIRMHQEKRYPGRVSATSLRNPDFAALARSYGAFGERVERTADFAAAFGRARSADGPALLHLLTDPRRLSPTMRL